MRIHRFYPRTNNIGDHFVQRGIEAMVRRIRPDATFELFDVNSRGRDRVEYGLTHRAVERANREADAIIVGGSNLYEGSYRWRWGVHLETEALEKLRVPLLLLGIGSGSGFGAPLHHASRSAKKEIKLLNDHAQLSGARDLITLDWLHELGITKAKLTGDPAAFIFDELPRKNRVGHFLIAIPPRRFWSGLHQFWNVRTQGRAMFKALVSLVRTLLKEGEDVVVACNDPLDLPRAKSLFDGILPDVVCPKTPEDYFQLLSTSRAVVSGRLHTAAVALSLAVPFVLLNVDQRTEGFLKTYQLESCGLEPSVDQIETALREQATKLMRGESSSAWEKSIEMRNEICRRTMNLLKDALPAGTLTVDPGAGTCDLRPKFKFAAPKS